MPKSSARKAVARLMAQTLKEEKAADKKLTVIAVGGINAQAATEWHEQESATEMLQKSAEWVGSTVGGAVTKAERTSCPGAPRRGSEAGQGNHAEVGARKHGTAGAVRRPGADRIRVDLIGPP